MRTKIKLKSQEWYDNRPSSIGSSDIGAISGVNDFASPLSIYNQKVGISHWEGSDQAEYGDHLEPFVAKKSFERLLLDGRVPEGSTLAINPYLYVAEDNPRFNASPDFFILDPDGTFILLECKTAKMYAMDKWKNGEVPASYYAQVEWQLYCTGLKHAFISCLVAGDMGSLFTHSIDRDNNYIRTLKLVGENFCHKLDNKTPPQAMNLDLDLMVEPSLEEVASVTPELLINFIKLDAEMKAMGKTREREKAKDSCRAAIEQEMGQKAYAELELEGIRYRFSRKTIEVKEKITKASSYVKFGFREFKINNN